MTAETYPSHQLLPDQTSATEGKTLLVTSIATSQLMCGAVVCALGKDHTTALLLGYFFNIQDQELCFASCMTISKSPV